MKVGAFTIAEVLITLGIIGVGCYDLACVDYKKSKQSSGGVIKEELFNNSSGI